MMCNDMAIPNMAAAAEMAVILVASSHGCVAMQIKNAETSSTDQ